MQGCPKPCDARRGDAARLLIFPITGVGFSEMPPRSQISPPLLLSFCLSVQQPSSPGAVAHRASPRHPGAGRGCRSLAQPQGPPVQPAGGGTELLRSHRARADPSGPRCCYKPEDAAVPGMGTGRSHHRHWLGIAQRVSKGAPRAGSSTVTAPVAPALCPSPGIRSAGEPCPRTPTQAQVYNEEGGQQWGSSSGALRWAVLRGVRVPACEARTSLPAPPVRAQTPTPGRGVSAPQGPWSSGWRGPGPGPSTAGLPGDSAVGVPPTAVPVWDGVAGTAAGRTYWGSQFPFLWVFSSIPWCLPPPRARHCR